MLGCGLFFVLSVKGDENVSARDDYHVVSLRAFCSISPLGWLFILGAPAWRVRTVVGAQCKAKNENVLSVVMYQPHYSR